MPASRTGRSPRPTPCPARPGTRQAPEALGGGHGPECCRQRPACRRSPGLCLGGCAGWRCLGSWGLKRSGRPAASGERPRDARRRPRAAGPAAAVLIGKAWGKGSDQICTRRPARNRDRQAQRFGRPASPPYRPASSASRPRVTGQDARHHRTTRQGRGRVQRLPRRPLFYGPSG